MTRTNRALLGISILRLLIVALALTWPIAASGQADTEIRYMKLNDETVGGRRLTFADKTVMSLYKNHDYRIAGPLHEGNHESGGRKPTRGRWEVRYGNTLLVTMEDGSSRSYVIFKIGERMHLKAMPAGVGGANPFGDRILSIAPLR
jgi:hypothetical protein